MQLTRTAQEHQRLVEALKKYISISDMIISEVSANFSIDTDQISDIVHEFRNKKCNSQGRGKLDSTLSKTISQKLPYFGFEPESYEKITRPIIYRDELMELYLLRNEIAASLLMDNKLSNFLGHDLGHIQGDSFDPFRRTSMGGWLYHIVWNAPEKNLTACIDNYKRNCKNALGIINYPFKFVYELAGKNIETSLTPKEMTDAVIGALNNRFFHMVYEKGVKLKNSIPEELRFKSNPNCYLSFIYNTMKNALKRSEGLSGYANDLIFT